MLSAAPANLWKRPDILALLGGLIFSLLITGSTRGQVLVSGRGAASVDPAAAPPGGPAWPGARGRPAVRRDTGRAVTGAVGGG